MLAYNMSGLKIKKSDPLFFNFINKFETFFLFETHVVEESISEYNNYFKEFVLYWVPAKKESKFGRAIGGELYCFKADKITVN